MIIDGFEVYVTCGGIRLQEATEEKDKSDAMVCSVEDLAGKDFSVCVNDLTPRKHQFMAFTVTVIAEGRKVAWDAKERRGEPEESNPLILDRGLDEERKERQLRFTVPRVDHGSGDGEPYDDQLGLLRVLVHRAKYKQRDSKAKPDPLSIDIRPIVKETHELSVRAQRQGFSTVTLGALVTPSEGFAAVRSKKKDGLRWRWRWFTAGNLIGTFDFRHESQRAVSQYNFEDEMDLREDEQPIHQQDEEWLDRGMHPPSDHSHSGSVPFGGSPRRSLSPLEDVPDPYAMDVDERELFAPAQTSTPRVSSSPPLDEGDMDAGPERDEDAGDSDIEIEADGGDLFAPAQASTPRNSDPSSSPLDERHVNARPEREEDADDSDVEIEVDEHDLFAPAQLAPSPRTPSSPSSIPLDERDQSEPAQASTPRTPSSPPLDERYADAKPEREEDAGDSDIESEIEVAQRNMFAPAQASTPKTAPSSSSLPLDEHDMDARPEREEDASDRGRDIDIDIDEHDPFAPIQTSTPRVSAPSSTIPLDERDGVDVRTEREDDDGVGDASDIELEQADVGMEPTIVPLPDLIAPDELTASVKLKKLRAKRTLLKAEKAYRKSCRNYERNNLEIIEVEEAEKVRKRKARRLLSEHE